MVDRYLIRVDIVNWFKVQYRTYDRWHFLDYTETKDHAEFIAKSYKEDTNRETRIIELKKPKVIQELI